MSQRVEREKRPLYRAGQLVNVIDYYDDMIVRGYYMALIVGVREVSYKSLTFGTAINFIYDLLPLKDGVYNKYHSVAEEQQLTLLEEK